MKTTTRAIANAIRAAVPEQDIVVISEQFETWAANLEVAADEELSDGRERILRKRCELMGLIAQELDGIVV